MSRLEELIQTLCPNGVEYKKLGEIGTFFGGLTGKTKQDFQNGNKKFISYMNVYKNPAVDIATEDLVMIGDEERQNTVEYGDILFTGSSETPEECGISSVMAKYPDEPFYLNSFTIGFRLYNSSLLNPHFSKHLFRSTELRKQINKTANGVTRFNVSKVKLSGVVIPVPPLQVQEEIVRILDTFSGVVAELEQKLNAEQAARVRQYEHYRKSIFTNVNSQTDHPFSSHKSSSELSFEKIVTIGEVCRKISSGGTPNSSNESFYGGKIPWLRTQEVNYGDIFDTEIKITEQGFENSSANWIPENSVIVAMYGASAARVAINKIPLTTNQACCNLEVNDKIANYKYVYYWLASQYNELKSLSEGAQPNLNSQKIKKYPIPLPSLDIQNQIVTILDRFEALVKDLKSGLPAEIALRRKQYEYYRDKLLTFQPLK